MKIEEGKFCRTACGKRAGPMRFENGRWYGRMGRYKDRYDWGADGKWMSDGTPHNLDLVAEWEDPAIPLIRQMREALQWMVDNDETNRGDEPMHDKGGQTWDEINAYWVEGWSALKPPLPQPTSS